ncbi:MAG: hypothetical protein KDD67_11170 [Ignavibacteriae bacterium]|nr:hypothetical protein [Ignavibacteriota bacterium]MCB9215849.1 hypothetical protein [Ignavibacteria bacterium]
MLVVKFGGSILNGAEGLQLACGEVEQLPRPLLVVVSAFEDVTNRLERVAELALVQKSEAEQAADSLFEDHRQIAREMLSTTAYKSWDQEVREWEERLRRIIEGLAIVGELSPRTLDLVVHFGERLSSSLVGRAISAPVISATNLLITDENHRFARVDLELSRERVQEHLQPLLQIAKRDKGEVGADQLSQVIEERGGVEGSPEVEGRRGDAVESSLREENASGIVVTEGYIARGRGGEITTMGRESSDFSAALFGELLGASEVRIYTGVPGIMTADPAIIPDAQTIPQMSYGMAREIASLGAKVIHPRTVRPVERANIPLVFNDLSGAVSVIDGDESGEAFSITALYQASLLTFKVDRTDTTLSPLLDLLLRTTPFIRSTRSGRILHVLVPIAEYNPETLIRKAKVADLILEYSATPVSVVSSVRQQGIGGEDATRFLSAIGEIPIRSIWSDSTERSISALVDPIHASDIVRALHRQFLSGL